MQSTVQMTDVSAGRPHIRISDSKEPLISNPNPSPPIHAHGRPRAFVFKPLHIIPTYPFDEVLRDVFASFEVEEVRQAKFSEILEWFQLRYCAKERPHSTIDPKERHRNEDCQIAWQVLLDHHSMLLIQHLDDLQDSIMQFRKQPDLCEDIDFEKFSVYFEFSCINLDTLLSNVLYSTIIWRSDWERDQKRQQQAKSPDSSAWRRDWERDQRHQQQAKSQDSPASSDRPPLPRSSSTPQTEATRPWVCITEEDLKYMEDERERQSQYSLISDGNYSYEVWDRLNKECREMMRVGRPSVNSPNHRYRDALKLMAQGCSSKQAQQRGLIATVIATIRQYLRPLLQYRLVAAIVRLVAAIVVFLTPLFQRLWKTKRPQHGGEIGAFDDYWRFSQVLWAVYHFGEKMVPSLLLIIVEPSNIFDEDKKDIVNWACVGVAIFFALGGVRQLVLKKDSNVHSLTMARRKHFLIKSMYVALLIRVVMLIDELVPTPETLAKRLEDPRTTPRKNNVQGRRASLPFDSTGSTARSLTSSLSTSALGSLENSPFLPSSRAQANISPLIQGAAGPYSQVPAVTSALGQSASSSILTTAVGPSSHIPITTGAIISLSSTPIPKTVSKNSIL